MKLGFLIPSFPNEKRIALLPDDIDNFDNDIYIEKGFGTSMNIDDSEYESKGCIVLSREEVFQKCEALVSLKLLQPSDYKLIRNNQIIIGWTHPEDSGKEFMEKQGIPKNLIIVDLDNIYPSVYHKDKKVRIDWIPSNFIHKNSFYAGFAGVLHAFMSYGEMPDSDTEVAVLGAGNVSQGAFSAISKLGGNTRLFYRKTMNQFKEDIDSFDIIINGIEIDDSSDHIITLIDQLKLKKNSFIIDVAADAGNTIEGSRYTSITEPIYKFNDTYYYCVNNVPSIVYRDASKAISKYFSRYVYSKNISVLSALIE